MFDHISGMILMIRSQGRLRHEVNYPLARGSEIIVHYSVQASLYAQCCQWNLRPTHHPSTHPHTHTHKHKHKHTRAQPPTQTQTQTQTHTHTKPPPPKKNKKKERAATKRCLMCPTTILLLQKKTYVSQCMPPDTPGIPFATATDANARTCKPW